MSPGEAVAEAGEALLGAPYRLRGRDPATGIDCLGLASLALTSAGYRPRIPPGYGLRSANIAPFIACAAASDLAEVGDGLIERGDLLLVRPGPAQHHLVIALAPSRIVHAHAGLGRVVAQPLPADWPVLHHWRARALAPES